MINLYNQVPTIYSNASRDFQFLSWLINIVLNSVKHNVDDLYILPKAGIDSRLSELLSFTLGFKVKRNYDKDQLLALVNIIPSLLKYKGTGYALELAGNALIKASGATGECEIIEDKESLKNGIIKLRLPKNLIDMSLFTDLLPYILPAGMTCSITRENVESSDLTTYVRYQQAPIARWQKEVELEKSNSTGYDYTGRIIGISGLFEPNEEDKVPGFNNYIEAKNGVIKLNAGLLDNTIIPVLDENELMRNTNNLNSLKSNDSTVNTAEPSST